MKTSLSNPLQSDALNSKTNINLHLFMHSQDHLPANWTSPYPVISGKVLYQSKCLYSVQTYQDQLQLNAALLSEMQQGTPLVPHNLELVPNMVGIPGLCVFDIFCEYVSMSPIRKLMMAEFSRNQPILCVKLQVVCLTPKQEPYYKLLFLHLHVLVLLAASYPSFSIQSLPPPHPWLLQIHKMEGVNPLTEVFTDDLEWGRQITQIFYFWNQDSEVWRKGTLGYFIKKSQQYHHWKCLWLSLLMQNFVKLKQDISVRYFRYVR